jgi:hypothetical protein
MQTAAIEQEPGGSPAAALHYQPRDIKPRLRSGIALFLGAAGVSFWFLIPLQFVLLHNMTKFGALSVAVSLSSRLVQSIGPTLAISTVAGWIAARSFAAHNRYWIFAAITLALFLIVEFIAAQVSFAYLPGAIYLFAIPILGFTGLIAGVCELFSKRFRKSHAITGLCLSLLNLGLCALFILMIGMVLDGMDGHPWQL